MFVLIKTTGSVYSCNRFVAPRNKTEDAIVKQVFTFTARQQAKNLLPAIAARRLLRLFSLMILHLVQKKTLWLIVMNTLLILLQVGASHPILTVAVAWFKERPASMKGRFNLEEWLLQFGFFFCVFICSLKDVETETYSVYTFICVNDQRDAQFLESIFIPQILSALHVSNESSHSSSGARHNILCYTVWYNRAIRRV